VAQTTNKFRSELFANAEATKPFGKRGIPFNCNVERVFNLESSSVVRGARPKARTMDEKAITI
jgi:hypothetical protein